jgi:hypothetical protein
MPACPGRRCVPWWAVVVVIAPLRMAVRDQGPRAIRSARSVGAAAGFFFFFFVVGVVSVRYRCSHSARCIPRQRSAGVWARICERPPAVLSTFSGHANCLSPPTSRLLARASSGAPANHHAWETWSRARCCLTICTSSSLHTNSLLQPASDLQPASTNL